MHHLLKTCLFCHIPHTGGLFEELYDLKPLALTERTTFRNDNFVPETKDERIGIDEELLTTTEGLPVERTLLLPMDCHCDRPHHLGRCHNAAFLKHRFPGTLRGLPARINAILSEFPCHSRTGVLACSPMKKPVRKSGVTVQVLLQHMQGMQHALTREIRAVRDELKADLSGTNIRLDRLERKVDLLGIQIENIDGRFDDLEVVEVPKLKKVIGMR